MPDEQALDDACLVLASESDRLCANVRFLFGAESFLTGNFRAVYLPERGLSGQDVLIDEYRVGKRFAELCVWGIEKPLRVEALNRTCRPHGDRETVDSRTPASA